MVRKGVNYHQCGCSFTSFNEFKGTSELENLVIFRELDQSLKVTPYISHKGLTSPEKSTCGILTVFNELEGEQKEFSKCKETSVKSRRN